MATDNTSEKITPAPDLRRRAEERLDAALSKTAGISQTEYDAARLLHELEVHHIELEMQNEELRRARDEAESNLLKYSDLYELAPVGYFTLDRRGQINSVNLRGASLVGVARSRLLGRSFTLLVMDVQRRIFTDFLNKVFISREKSSCEVTLKNRDNNTPIVVLLEGMAAVSGEECVLVLIDISGRKRIEGELSSFASRIIIMEEEFRKKIAMELHNDICSDLTLLGMNVASIVDGIKEVASPKLTTKAIDSARLVKEINRTVRNIMDGLCPPVLEEYGLPAALRWHAELFSKRSGITVSILIAEPFPRLTQEQEMTLFRISQEALMNISKHANSRIATIRLSMVEGMIRFTVTDEGDGFLPAKSLKIQNGTGWGVQIMRERVKLAGGKFHIHSVPGTGSTVAVVIPVGGM